MCCDDSTLVKINRKPVCSYTCVSPPVVLAGRINGNSI